MKQTKKELELLKKLEKYNLPPNQLEPIVKLFRSFKDEVSCIDNAERFRDINEGKKVRDFMFVYKDGCEKKRGVYKLTFGSNKFYIGRSKFIETRFKQHWKELHTFFQTGKYNADHYLRKVYEHLIENQFGYYFEVKLLDGCYSIDELQIKEQKWLDKYNGNPNCLNVGFVSKKLKNEIDETQEEQWDRKANTGIARRGGRLIFYPKKKIETDVLDRRSESVKKYQPYRKEAANSFLFNVPEMKVIEEIATVFKLFYGDIYVVHKGKTLAGSLFMLQKNLGYYIAYDHNKDNKFEKDYYFKFYDFIRRNPDRNFRVEVILKSCDAFEVLKTEQIELNKALGDKKCYNNNIQAYIPTFREKTNMHGWITPEEVSKFYSFLESI